MVEVVEVVVVMVEVVEVVGAKDVRTRHLWEQPAGREDQASINIVQ